MAELGATVATLQADNNRLLATLTGERALAAV